MNWIGADRGRRRQAQDFIVSSREIIATVEGKIQRNRWLNEIHWTELRLSMYIIDVQNDSSSDVNHFICRFTRFFNFSCERLLDLQLATQSCINFVHDISLQITKGRDVSKFRQYSTILTRNLNERWETNSLVNYIAGWLILSNLFAVYQNVVASKDLQDLQFDRLTRIGERVDSNKNRLEKKGRKLWKSIIRTG